MTRQKFRLLVVFNQLCVFGTLLVDEAAQRAIPEELRSYFSLDQSVLDSPADYNPLSGDLPYTLSVGLMILGVIGAAGLCFGQNWGRRLFAFCIVGNLLLASLSTYFIGTGWGSGATYINDITSGMILALVYFSPVRRMFTRESEEAGGG